MAAILKNHFPKAGFHRTFSANPHVHAVGPKKKKKKKKR